jgi:hypothetical protein
VQSAETAVASISAAPDTSESRDARALRSVLTGESGSAELNAGADAGCWDAVARATRVLPVLRGRRSAGMEREDRDDVLLTGKALEEGSSREHANAIPNALVSGDEQRQVTTKW